MGSLFGKTKARAVKAQEDAMTPPLMPDEETLRKSRRRSFQRKRRSGRESTKLTDQLG